MKIGLGIFVLFVLPGLVACNPAKKIAVLDAEELRFEGLTSVAGRVLVESGAAKDLTVESGTLWFYYKGRELATQRLMSPATAHAGTTEWVQVEFALEGKLANLQTLMRRMEANPGDLTVSIEACVRYGNIRRTIRKKDVPYIEFIANFGL